MVNIAKVSGTVTGKHTGDITATGKHSGDKVCFML